MLRKKAVKMPEEDNLTLPHISKMLSNLFGKEGHLQSPSSSLTRRKYPIIHMITQFNLANCVTTKFQINPERRGVCVHTIQNNITFLTSAKRDCNGWVVFMTLTKKLLSTGL